MALTDIQIKRAQPGVKTFKLSDSHGLFIQIQPSGAKYWRLAYRFAGKQKTLAMGVYPVISLSMAREDRARAKKLLQEGVDPGLILSKKAKNVKAIKNDNNSFKAQATAWLNDKKVLWSEKHTKTVLNNLKKEVFPFIGSIPIIGVTTPDIAAILKKIKDRDALNVAVNTLAYCSAIFRYAIQHGIATENPASHLKGSITTKKTIHRRSIKDIELSDFYKKLEVYQGERITCLALKLIVLTFVRTNELRLASWSEFDFKKAEWLIPGNRMKMGEDHIVPLSDQALEVLHELKAITGQANLVFPGLSNKKPISSNTMLYAMYNMGYKNKATVHGFRSTASTILHENGFKSEMIERQLAHAEKNQSKAAYDRSTYLSERHKMMKWWANYLDSQLNSQNIIPFSKYSRPT